MSPEAQRIAIAKVCGYFTERVERVLDEEKMFPWRLCNREGVQIGPFWASESGAWSHGIPDYLSDLNAMHEAEKGLAKEQVHIYKNRLCDLVPAHIADTFGYWPVIHATAAQRAEAFLRALVKWEDGK